MTGKVSWRWPLGFKPVGQTIKCLLFSSILNPALFYSNDRQQKTASSVIVGKMIENLGKPNRLLTEVDLEKIKLTAEEYYRSGDFYCSEAIVKTIKDAFQLPVSDDVIAAASGFPVGMGGAGCTCGAVAGGVMALGLVFGRCTPKDSKVDKAMKLSRELHDLFQKRHKHLCCRSLTKFMLMGASRQMEQCIAFTGEMAQETARIIIREQSKVK